MCFFLLFDHVFPLLFDQRNSKKMMVSTVVVCILLKINYLRCKMCEFPVCSFIRELGLSYEFALCIDLVNQY